jgi:hypothetical protein
MRKPNVRLTGIEYLLVCIQANPGQSQRYYLRRLYQYKHGTPDPTGGSRGVGYFTSDSYRDVLWRDKAPKNSRGRIWNGYKPKPSCSAMYLTRAGQLRANAGRAKIGLASWRGPGWVLA